MLSSVLLLFLAASIAVSQVPNPAKTNLKKEIGRAIRERLDAYARDDAIGWGRLVADDFRCGTSTKAALQKEIAARLPNVKNWYGDIENLEVNLYGDVVVARYRVAEFSEIAGQRIPLQQWRTETHIRSGGGWKLISGADSIIPADPVVAKVNPKTFDACVGQYEYAP